MGPSRGTRRFYWAFPAGDHLRAGLATYTGESDLADDLVRFCHDLRLGEPGPVHGGFFTSRLIDPVRDGMFLVGDSAGMCLPVSGEGIRPALVYGQVAGRLAERVRTGEMTLPGALAAYRGIVASRARGYRILDRLQTVLDLHRPALVLAVGQAGGREALCLERVAINVQDARIPDNDGAQPIDRPAVEGGPAAHFTGLPVKACVAALRDAGLKAAVSNTAGTFVCNHLFYALMHAAGPRGIRAGFLHVPVLPTQQEALAGAPSMAVEDIARGIVVVLETCAARSADIATAEGALD